jgi:hypothetical protein
MLVDDGRKRFKECFGRDPVVSCLSSVEKRKDLFLDLPNQGEVEQPMPRLRYETSEQDRLCNVQNVSCRRPLTAHGLE